MPSIAASKDRDPLTSKRSTEELPPSRVSSITVLVTSLKLAFSAKAGYRSSSMSNFYYRLNHLSREHWGRYLNRKYAGLRLWRSCDTDLRSDDPYRFDKTLPRIKTQSLLLMADYYYADRGRITLSNTSFEYFLLSDVPYCYILSLHVARLIHAYN